MERFWITSAITAAFVAGFLAHGTVPTVQAQAAPVYELRTYTAQDGKLTNLHARFRDHTLRIFEKHGIENVAYFAPTDEPLSRNTLIYVIAHDSPEAATANWEAFRADPEWQQVAADSQVDGRIVAGIESVFMTATDYSPLRY
jgi:hypothetical protein